MASSSDTLLLSLLPKAVREALFPYAALAILSAGAGYAIGVELEHYMILFATLFLAFSAGLAKDAWLGLQERDDELKFGLGASSLCLLIVGFLGEFPVLTAISPLIALSGLVLESRPAMVLDAADTAAEVTETMDKVMPLDGATVGSKSPSRDPGRALNLPQAQASTSIFVPAEPAFGPGKFVDGWFCLKMISTYADTNSVGNVYFANYALWIGKTRELCFRTAMPDFDLKTTNWLILTRQFQHKYLRELKEFDEVVCRVRAASFDKRFVEIRHEIRDRSNQLIGIGSQTLMFVDSRSYRAIDIPAEFINAFTPYL